MILIAGPTASGKSALALDLAEKNHGEIINTDSMQAYDLLNVLTGRPSQLDLNRITHHLYGCVPVYEVYTVSKWLQHVSSVLDDLKLREKIPIFVGGTGLYFRALLDGLAEVPAIPSTIRNEVRQRLREGKKESLFQQLETLDPFLAKRIHASDGQRVARALEVILATEKSLLLFQKTCSKSPLFSYESQLKLLLLPEHSVMNDRINSRTESIFNNGAIEEVSTLLKQKIPTNCGISRAIGVDLITRYLEKNLDIHTCIDQVKLSSRQYAKRQSTWFRNQFDESWKILSSY